MAPTLLSRMILMGGKGSGSLRPRQSRKLGTRKTSWDSKCFSPKRDLGAGPGSLIDNSSVYPELLSFYFKTKTKKEKTKTGRGGGLSNLEQQWPATGASLCSCSCH